VMLDTLVLSRHGAGKSLHAIIASSTSRQSLLATINPSINKFILPVFKFIRHVDRP